MADKKSNIRKGLTFIIAAIFISISLMPLATHFPLAAGASNVSEKNYIEVDVAQYEADGSVNKKVVMLPADEANELKERLISAKTFEDRFFILKEYGLIMKESMKSWQNGMYERASKLAITESGAHQITSTYEGMGLLNLPILLNFFCRINALYVISGEAHLGLPPIIGLTKFLGGSGVLSFDLADMCWGAFGMVETKGLLRTHTMAAAASFMALTGFVGVHVHIPFLLDLYNGFSAMTFAVGLGMKYINFNLVTFSLLSFVVGALLMQGLSGLSGGSGESGSGS
ncbi:MAG TPA: hypothetical protein ENF91_02050 [Thermoplasmatales archaeon]|nr:MAG: hypothetical protein DRN17_01525 [Thermoplasmata archaeon]HDH81858.1 hypothetical protein [Thermoplasmatales archaeon]